MDEVGFDEHLPPKIFEISPLPGLDWQDVQFAENPAD